MIGRNNIGGLRLNILVVILILAALGASLFFLFRENHSVDLSEAFTSVAGIVSEVKEELAGRSKTAR